MSDNCPEWASEKIDQLRQIEVFLGNIPKTADWKSNHCKDIMKRSFEKEVQVFDDAKAELVFKRIVKSLANEGFNIETIVGFFNTRIDYENGPVYCDASEVSEALQN